MKYGIGIYEKGKYQAVQNGKETREYITWASILKRCCHRYDNHKIYTNCDICDEWLYFQVFADWFNNNYYQIQNDTMFIDKDLLIPNNTLYCPDTCLFVNRRINNFLTLRQNHRGDLPLGVRHPKTSNKNPYQAYITKNNNIIILGSYKTVEEAFNVYCESKNTYAKELADFYKSYIPIKLYEALYNFDIRNYSSKL